MASATRKKPARTRARKKKAPTPAAEPPAVAVLRPADRAIIALSVYNALSFTGRDMTVNECVGFLATHWSPSLSPNAERMSPTTVASSAEYLRRMGFVTFERDKIGITVRDTRTKRGRPLDVDYEAGEVVAEKGRK